MQLSRLLTLLRAHGVSSYSDADGLSITFGPQPVTAPAPPKAEDEKPKDPPLPTDAVALALTLGAR